MKKLLYKNFLAITLLFSASLLTISPAIAADPFAAASTQVNDTNLSSPNDWKARKKLNHQKWKQAKYQLRKEAKFNRELAEAPESSKQLTSPSQVIQETPRASKNKYDQRTRTKGLKAQRGKKPNKKTAKSSKAFSQEVLNEVAAYKTKRRSLYNQLSPEAKKALKQKKKIRKA